MNPFLREHAGPIVGSTLLHVLLGVAALVATWYAVAPKIVAPAVMEAYIASGPPARPPPAPVAAPEPAPAPAPPEQTVPEPPAPDPAVLALKAQAEQAAALAAEREAAVRHEHEADVRAADSAAHLKQHEADARRRAAAAAAAEARRRAEADAAQHRAQAEAEAAKRAAADAAAKRQAAADAKQRAVRETELAKALAAEEQRTGAVDAGLQARYAAAIRAAVERAWNKPPTARPGLHCQVRVTQVPGGTVTDVKIGTCNGDAAVQESIKLAVNRASPLPAPPDPSLFERNLQLEFAPND